MVWLVDRRGRCYRGRARYDVRFEKTEVSRALADPEFVGSIMQQAIAERARIFREKRGKEEFDEESEEDNLL